jgi:acyl carrier protein
MRPSFYERLDSLPLNRHGKVDRRGLPRPGPGAEPDAAFEVPCGDTEERLAAIWQSAFGVTAISAAKSFIDLGGDSLKAMRVIGEVYGEFGVELELGALFEHPSIRALARLLEERM